MRSRIGRDDSARAIIRTPWELPKTLERIIGFLEIVIGVFTMIIINGAIVVYPPPARLIGQIGMLSFGSLVLCFILVMDGRRRLIKVKILSEKGHSEDSV